MYCQKSVKEEEKTYQYIDNIEDAERVARFLEDLYYSHTDDQAFKLAVDVETYSIDPMLEAGKPPRPIKTAGGYYQGMIKTLQIGVCPDVQDIQFVIDIEKIADNRRIEDLFRSILEKSLVIGQNLKYDWQFLHVHLGINLTDMRDTMLIGQVEHAGDKKSHNLSSMYFRYLVESRFIRLTGMNFTEYAEFKKREQKSGWRGDLSEEQIKYASEDVRLVFFLYDAMLDSVDLFIEKYEQTNRSDQSIVHTILLECQLIPIYAMMELRGVKFDLDYHRSVVLPTLESKMEEFKREVGKYFTKKVQKSNGKRGKAREVWEEEETINLNSPAQIKAALESVGVPMPKEKATGEKYLTKVQGMHPSISWIVGYKKASSLNSKFGQKLLEMSEQTGVIHAQWFQIGSDDSSIDTGRSCCKDPNLMQIPNREDSIVEKWGTSLSLLFRKSFIARPGFILIDADYSQIEPCVQAEMCDEISQIEDFIDAALKGHKMDTHWLTAKAVFSIKEPYNKENPTHKKYRQIGKVLNLGISYGMGVKKLAASITEATGQECTEEQARGFIESFYSNLPGIKRTKALVERIVKSLAEKHESLAPFAGRKPIAVYRTYHGRPRRWCLKTVGDEDEDQESLALKNPQVLGKFYNGGRYNIYSKRLSEIVREAYNFMIQGTCADMLKQALIYIRKAFIDAGFDQDTEVVIMVVHDEVVAEVKIEHAEQAKEIIKTCMIKAAKEICTRVPIDIGIAAGQNWAEAH